MSNITLIGMPGCGKSTIGVVLAKVMGMKFTDCDLLIQEKTGKLLHTIIEESGNDGFIQTENKIISEIETNNSIIATGGSAVYGKEAMAHLKQISKIVYIKLSYEEIENRLGDLHERGVVLEDGKTLLDLYNERCKLYEKYADIIAETEGLSVRESVALIRKNF
jgi:shikimate kinase